MWYKKKKKELIEFNPSCFWGDVSFLKTASAQLSGVPDFVPYADEKLYSEELSNLADFYGDVDNLFSQNVGRNIHGFDSLYLDREGNFALIQPHTHNAIARDVLTSVYPELPSKKEDSKYKKGGGYTHADLTQLSGIQRIQIYNDGMGITVEMRNSPNKRQLSAIRDAYSMTTMDKFVAEIRLDGEIIAHIDTFSEFVYFVNNFDPNDPSSMDEVNKHLSTMFR
jgi:hypothetical protein